MVLGATYNRRPCCYRQGNQHVGVQVPALPLNHFHVNCSAIQEVN